MQTRESCGSLLRAASAWPRLQLESPTARRVAAGKKLEFDFERAVFAIVLQRIVAPGSDRAGAKWIHTVFARGFDRLDLQHFYRALQVLWHDKERIELALFRRDRNLFNQKLDLVFFDTTSLYFEGKGPKGLAEMGLPGAHASRANTPPPVGRLSSSHCRAGWTSANAAQFGKRILRSV